MRDIDKVIGALRSPTRRELLGLIWSEELRAGDIAAAFDLTKPTISQHLSVLREAGLVKMRAAGTSRRYLARQEALDGLHAALEGSLKWSPADHIPERARSEARTTPAVASGRSVTLSPSRSSNVYISFETMSVSSPIERLKSSVRSSTGRRTRR